MRYQVRSGTKPGNGGTCACARRSGHAGAAASERLPRSRAHLCAGDRRRARATRSVAAVCATLDERVSTTAVAAESASNGTPAASTEDGKAARRSGRWSPSARKAAGDHAVVFDRGGFLYHGRVKAVAEGAREGGLDF